jgi:hypothetical protein
MAATGPDFKKQFADPSPISNADIAPTFAQILGFDLGGKGKWKGRILREALVGGPATVSSTRRAVASRVAANGMRTRLLFQQSGPQVYFDQACFTDTHAEMPTNAPCP